MKILNFFYNLLFKTNGIDTVSTNNENTEKSIFPEALCKSSTNENTSQGEFSRAHCESGTNVNTVQDVITEGQLKSNSNEKIVNDFEFQESLKPKINSEGNINITTESFRFVDPIQCDFDKYKKIELFIMIFDNTKLTIENYADNYSELSRFFNAGKPPIDGILYLGRDSQDSKKIIETFNANTIGSVMFDFHIYGPPFDGVHDVSEYYRKFHPKIPLYNEITETSTLQICYNYAAYILKDQDPVNHVEPKAEIYYFRLNGPIKGVNSESIEKERISLVVGFRLTKKDSDVQEIHFTKSPLNFEFCDEKDYFLTNLFPLQDKAFNNLKQDGNKEHQDSKETTNSSTHENMAYLKSRVDSDKIEN